MTDFVANRIYIDSRLTAGMDRIWDSRIAAATSFQQNANINRRRPYDNSHNFHSRPRSGIHFSLIYTFIDV